MIPGPPPVRVRAWSDALPFAADSFDAVFCKGSLDHFDRPRAAIAEMARVAKADGRVVLAVANFESAACRAAQRLDDLRERWRGRELPRGRRHYDVPHDHFTRYELPLMREQAGEAHRLEVVEGVSLACRAARAVDDTRERRLGRPPRRGRRHYDVPADHFTRYELGLLPPSWIATRYQKPSL